MEVEALKAKQLRGLDCFDQTTYKAATRQDQGREELENKREEVCSSFSGENGHRYGTLLLI